MEELIKIDIIMVIIWCVVGIVGMASIMYMDNKKLTYGDFAFSISIGAMGGPIVLVIFLWGLIQRIKLPTNFWDRRIL